MLQLTKRHERAMKTYALEQYVDRTFSQYQEHFPRHCEVNGEEPMRAMIRFGVDRAAQYGIAAERNVVLYTTMMLLFGSYFDEDPMTPWAKQVLADTTLVTENARAERLYDEGEAHWQAIAGDDNRNMVLAIDRLRNANVEEAALLPEQQWPKKLEEIFPARCRVIGKTGQGRIVRTAGSRLARYALESPRDRALFSALILMLGTRFDEDPMYPWVREALQPAIEPDAPDRGEQLLTAAHAYADAWLEHVKEVV